MPLGMIQENSNPCLRQGVLEEAGEAGQANREAERGLLGKEWFKGGWELIGEMGGWR